MPPVCTCGAVLPDDARFCHRCGKPQREEDNDFFGKLEPAIPVGPPSSPPPLPTAPAVSSVTFSNPLALRTSLLVASMTTVLLAIPYVGFVAPLLGGYLSASLYQRRAGRAISPGAGAKLGWITGVIYGLFLTVLMTVNFAIGGAGLFDQLRESIRRQSNNPMQGDFLQLLNNPYGIAAIVLVSWVLLFGFSSLSAVAGGALSARLYRPKSS